MRGFVWILLAGVVLLAACNDDMSMEAYSNRGAEHDKSVLDANAEKLDDQLYQLSRTDFAILSHAMSERLSDEATGNVQFLKAVVNIGQLMYQNESEDCYFEELMKLTFDKDYYCSVLEKEGCGEWQWNGTTASFEKLKEHETDVIFKFPASENLEGDTAVLTISDMLFYNGSFPQKGDALEDGTVLEQALQKLHFNIKIKDELILASNVNASFSDDGFFEIVAMSFNPQPFNLSGELGVEDESGYWTLGFNHGDDAIFSSHLDMVFDKGNNDMPVTSIVNNFTLEEVMVYTEAKTGQLYNELVRLSALDPDSRAYAEDLASALNEFALMKLKYQSDNSLIANVEALAEPSGEGDAWEVDLVFEFSDGSLESSEKYFKNYLVEFKMELEQLIADFRGKFGF
ncbi:hypothetical protein [Carboxylicivirga taeanensis]|uniref:hypothetical protein n=1 Tax=Carboxylicivirga taeanensis TaxID=1416875 RepID=UPI003F6DF396